jgi:precorrin-2 dehydrogenase/sirohydrochlorin ferrochelatase
VVGGGAVAARKVGDLLASKADVTVVSPKICDAMKVHQDNIRYLARPFEKGDEAGAFLVFAATDRPDINQQVAQSAQAAGALVNIVDAPTQCDFVVPSKVQRGQLQLTVSTNGTAPALTKHLRKELETLFTAEHEQWVALVGDARKQVLSRENLDESQRRTLLRAIVALPILDWLREGRLDKAKQEIDRCILQS